MFIHSLCNILYFATTLRRCIKVFANTRHYSLVPFAGDFRRAVFISAIQARKSILNHSAGFFVANILNMARPFDFQHINILRVFLRSLPELINHSFTALSERQNLCYSPLVFSCGGFAISFTPFCRKTFSSNILTPFFRILSFALGLHTLSKSFANYFPRYCSQIAQLQQTHIKIWGQAGTCATRNKRKAFTLNHGRHS